MTKKIAIVTGASSGLGKEYVRQIDGQWGIEEIWVIARRADRLHELKAAVKTPVRPVSLDLTDPLRIMELKDLLAAEEPVIRLLINAAGMAHIAKVKDTTLEYTHRMIDLNVRSLSDVTAVCLPYMERGSAIMNIGSIAGFQPIPGLGIYAATKSYVESYSKALHRELRKDGISVTCVCPYWIKDTEFIDVASKDSAGGFTYFPLATKKKFVAEKSLKDAMKKRWISTPGIVTSADRIAAKIIPDVIMVRIMELAGKF